MMRFITTVNTKQEPVNIY